MLKHCKLIHDESNRHCQALLHAASEAPKLGPKGRRTLGGYVPLGYDVKDRKLVVNEEEVATVRGIFERFVEVGSATVLARELRRKGLRN